MISGNHSQDLGFRDPLKELRQIELRRRVQGSGYMLLFSLAITGAMAVMALSGGDLWQATALFSVATLILITFIAINLVGPSRKTPLLVGALLLVLYFYLLLSGRRK